MDLISQEHCTCECHHFSGVTHLQACCDGLPVDFWDEYDEQVELFGSSESSKPKGRSAAYERPEEWLIYLNNSKTGKPKWDFDLAPPSD